MLAHRGMARGGILHPGQDSMALERRTCMLKVTSEIHVYNNNNIGHDIGYDIGYSDNIEVFSFDIVGNSSISYLDIRTPFWQFYDVGLRYRVRYRSFFLDIEEKISCSDIMTLLKHASCHSSISKVKTTISKKKYDVVHDIVTRYEDAPNSLFLPPDIKPDIVEKEPISKENVPAISEKYVECFC